MPAGGLSSVWVEMERTALLPKGYCCPRAFLASAQPGTRWTVVADETGDIGSPTWTSELGLEDKKKGAEHHVNERETGQVVKKGALGRWRCLVFRRALACV
jgi:hypothetical protein